MQGFRKMKPPNKVQFGAVLVPDFASRKRKAEIEYSVFSIQFPVFRPLRRVSCRLAPSVALRRTGKAESRSEIRPEVGMGVGFSRI